MKKLILILAILINSVIIWYTGVYASPNPQPTEGAWEECKWIKLNTNVPFLWKCIVTHSSSTDDGWKEVITPINAFPKLIWSLMNLLMTVILIMSLLMIVWSWVLITMSWVDSSKYSDWVNLLKRIATWMALLGASWVILKVINPNFFV